MIGRTLSHYRITAKLGEGGMGEVWRATDTKLDREVALKVLPNALAGDPARLERFEREARAIAALNHPNIVTIHSVEEVEGVHLLTMERVEGESLDRVLPSSGFESERLFPLAIQIAGALAAAHEKGITHRDLKPANVMVTADDHVKVLDFGLAKLADSEDGGGEAEKTELLTQEGIILGTVPYMSPEQVQGRPIDQRSDIFSLGILLFEMATGKRPFGGDNPASVLSAVLKDQPPSVTELKTDLPNHLGRIVRRCLEKNPLRRYQSAREIQLELEGLQKELGTPVSRSDGGQVQGEVSLTRKSPASWPVVALVGVLGIALGALLVWSTARPSGAAPSLQQLDLVLDPPPALGGMALTSDAKTLIYVAERADGERMLYRRDLGGFESRVIPGTEAASDPFLSPDDQEVGFFAPGRLKRVGLSGGLPTLVCNTNGVPTGAAWTVGNEIVFATDALLIPHRVRVDEGGESQPVRVEGLESGMTMLAPRPLPGVPGSVLVTIGGPSLDGEHVGVLELESGRWKTIVRGFDARLLAGGYLLFAQKDRVVTASFDVDRLELAGPERTTPLEQAAVSSGYAGDRFYTAAAADGTVVYPVGKFGENHLFRLSRGADLEPLGIAADAAVLDAAGERLLAWGHAGVVLVDLREGAREPQPLLEPGAWYPRWSTDGSRIVFSQPLAGERQWLEGVRGIFAISAEGTDVSELLAVDVSVIPTSVGPDGTLMGYQIHPETSRDVWMLSPHGELQMLVHTRHNERAAAISPDGQWFAFVSDEEEGIDQVFVRSLADDRRRWQVSTDGGFGPVWSRDGTEVFYRQGNRLLATRVTTSGSSLRVNPPREVFVSERLFEEGLGNPTFDTAPDGSLIVILTEPSAVRTRVVLNWEPGVEVQ